MSSRILALSHKSQVNLTTPTITRMYLLSLCALAAVIHSSITDGGASLLIALSALLAALLTESLTCIKTGRLTILDGSAAVSALVLTLLLPNTIHPSVAAVGAVFAIAVTKISYGGLGGTWFNPAISALLFLRLSWGDVFKNALASSPLAVFSAGAAEGDGGSIGQAIEYLRQNGFETTSGGITSFMNNYPLKIFNVEYPAYYLDFFNAEYTGIIADRGIFALVLGSLLLLTFGVSRYVYSAIYLGVLLILAKIFGGFLSGGDFFSGDILFALFSGGTLVAAFFLLCEPSSSPKTSGAKYITAVLAAVLTFLFRYVQNEPYGAVYAIALINMIVPVIRVIESALFFEAKKELPNA
ncbi:MAG: hypothetical protein Ta2G_13230 [Termitinemataceae bacterium]|nr:MAG: hypothetical protein Ta2G_13230 [Termitinemataceae bacterium]